MNQVTIDEIVDALLECKDFPLTAIAIGEQLREHGIAPPEDMCIVPIEPTAEMVHAGQLGVTTSCTKAIYKAMLEASKDNHEQ